MSSDLGFRWTQDSWGPDDAGAGAGAAASRTNRLIWLGFIALAVVSFELTSDPVLSTALGCLKFGWGEFREARWLKRTDPDRRRGRICSRFYLAWGLWRVSLVGAALFFLIAFASVGIEEVLGVAPAGNGPPAAAMTAFLLALAGFSASAAFSAWAVLSACRHRVKVWVGPEARWAREEGLWPPQDAGRRRATVNRGRAILMSAVLTVVAFGLSVFLLAVLAWSMRGRPAVGLTVAIVFVPIFALPVAVLVLTEKLGRLVIATGPSDCWKTGPDGSL